MKQRGFTLIELLCVVVIIGILAQISIFSIQEYRLRAYNTSAEVVNRDLIVAGNALLGDMGDQGLGITYSAVNNVLNGSTTTGGSYTGNSTIASIVPGIQGDENLYWSLFLRNADTHLIQIYTHDCRADIENNYFSYVEDGELANRTVSTSNVAWGCPAA